MIKHNIGKYPGKRKAAVKAAFYERETGLEPATLSLGS